MRIEKHGRDSPPFVKPKLTYFKTKQKCRFCPRHRRGMFVCECRLSFAAPVSLSVLLWC